MSFHIGEVDNEVLAEPDYGDVKAFIKLNYKMFTGDELGASWLKRLMGG